MDTTLKHTIAILLLGLALAFCLPAWAEDEEVEEGAEEALNSAIYIPLAPPFVVNYGGTGRLKYLKAEMSVRAANVQTSEAVTHHMPLIRNALVLLMSRQTDEDINSQIGVENLLSAARDEINALLEAEQSAHEVVEVYFNSFVVQK